MRLGTTLCLHLNNPRARGYAYPRDFVLPSSFHTPLPRIVSICLAPCNSRGAYFPVETGNAASTACILGQRVCVCARVCVCVCTRVNIGEGEFSPASLFRSRGGEILEVRIIIRSDRTFYFVKEGFALRAKLLLLTKIVELVKAKI